MGPDARRPPAGHQTAINFNPAAGCSMLGAEQTQPVGIHAVRDAVAGDNDRDQPVRGGHRRRTGARPGIQEAPS